MTKHSIRLMMTTSTMLDSILTKAAEATAATAQEQSVSL